MASVLVGLMPRKLKTEKDSSGVAKCPHCASLETRKNGIVRGDQRYYCRRCDINFHLLSAKELPRFVRPLLEFLTRVPVKYAKKIKGSPDSMPSKAATGRLAEIVWDEPALFKNIDHAPLEREGKRGIRAVYYYDQEDYRGFQIVFTEGYQVSLGEYK